MFVVRDIQLYFYLSWKSSNCTQVQWDWHKSKLLQREHKNGKAELQYNACVVNRYYCELINQARKHSKYPVPVFVPQRATGLRNINTACVCLFVCVYVNKGVIPSQVIIVVLLCLYYCVCATACSYLCVPVCEHKQRPDDNTIIIYNQVNGVFLSAGWQKRSLFSTHLFSQSGY